MRIITQHLVVYSDPQKKLCTYYTSHQLQGQEIQSARAVTFYCEIVIRLS